jgi:hypothetical protein
MGYGSNEFNVQSPITLLLCVKTHSVDDSQYSPWNTNLTPGSDSQYDPWNTNLTPPGSECAPTRGVRFVCCCGARGERAQPRPLRVLGQVSRRGLYSC